VENTYLVQLYNKTCEFIRFCSSAVEVSILLDVAMQHNLLTQFTYAPPPPKTKMGGGAYAWIL